MRIYLDDDADINLYIAILSAAGFEIISPRKIGMRHKSDIGHIKTATRLNATILTHNGDFSIIHKSFLNEKKSHYGIFIVYRYNNPKKDMKPFHIVRAIKNIISLNLPIPNSLYNLNQFKY